jgi:hypothetical protein
MTSTGRHAARVYADTDLGIGCRMEWSWTNSHLGELVIKKLIIVLALVVIGGLVAKKVTSS